MYRAVGPRARRRVDPLAVGRAGCTLPDPLMWILNGTVTLTLPSSRMLKSSPYLVASQEAIGCV
jgi:hypothetical protein